MAKKAKKVVVKEPQIQEEIAIKTAPVVQQPKPNKVEPKKPSWEIKDRVYYLTKKRRPLSYMVKSAGIYFLMKKKVMKES